MNLPAIFPNTTPGILRHPAQRPERLPGLNPAKSPESLNSDHWVHFGNSQPRPLQGKYDYQPTWGQRLLQWLFHLTIRIERWAIPLPQDETSKVACHELAHAIIAKACGYRVTTINIIPDDKRDGYVRYQSLFNRHDQGEYYKKRILTSLIPVAMVNHFYSGYDSIQGIRGDLEQVRKMLRAGLNTGVFSKEDLGEAFLNVRLKNDKFMSTARMRDQTFVVPIIREALALLDGTAKLVRRSTMRDMIEELKSIGEIASEQQVNEFLFRHIPVEEDWQMLSYMINVFLTNSKESKDAVAWLLNPPKRSLDTTLRPNPA